MSKIKENVKKFWEENKRDILYYTAGAVVGGVVMYQCGKMDAIPWGKEGRKNIGEVFRAKTGRPKNNSSLTTIAGKPYKLNQLGELGKDIIEQYGTPEDLNMDRFIILGDPWKK